MLPWTLIPKKAQHVAQRPLVPKPRTLRLSQIPCSLDSDRFRQYLAQLECETGLPDDNVCGFSLVPYKDWQVSTVSFRQEPQCFKQCGPGNSLQIRLPSDVVSDGTLITVDCDFHAMTPLYAPPVANIAYE